ncbi:MAG: type IV pilus biogenesis protein PilM [Desulfovibrio sp.]|nr:type IV pilus biogenesis protein PilM [Desulfovibrio sp.]
MRLNKSHGPEMIMRAMAILTFLVSLTAFLYRDDQTEYLDSLADVVAANYVAYRNASWRYVYNNKSVSGEIPTTVNNGVLYIGDVLLINNFHFINDRIWHTYVNDGVCYIYGALSIKEINAAKAKLKDSYGLGFANNGYLVNNKGGGSIRLPDYVTQTAVPAGKYLFVSVSNLD